MSVINQMLVDLERRRASGEERNRIPDHVRALPDEPHAARGAGLRIGAAVAVLVLLAAGAWWWQTGRTPAVSVPAAAPATIASAPAAPASVPEARDTEFIARRLTLDLAYVPETPAPAAAPGLDTAAVIRPRAATPAPQPEASIEKPRAAAPAVKKTPEPVPAAVEIDKQMRKPTPRQRAEAEYAKGAAARQQGQAEEARAAFEAALQIDPSYHGARQALVGTLLDARLSAEAIRVLQEGLQLAPAQQGFAMTLARLQLDNGELDTAAQTLARSLDYPDVSPDYIAFYASLLQRQQKHAEAVTQFQRALGRRRNVGVWLLGLGVSFEALGRGAEAQEAYRLAKTSGNLSADLQAFADQKLR
ncbi:MAG: tetratricopeptide repeat protein [Burkholderiales bacterium]|nr:tetratricopeptide repeat protein [Burkholderiales bacterium]